MKNHLLMPKFLTYFFPKKFGGITISKNTALYRDIKNLQNEKIKIHEEIHMEQYEKYTWLGFIALYTFYSIRYGYWNNPLEIEAREKTEKTINKINSFLA